MSYQPVSGIVPQYSTDDNELANGYYLKFYQANTTTPLSMAIDSSGATLLVKCKLSSAGFPISNPLDNSTVFIPHVNANYRLVIYPTEADANANNTASALVNIPDVGTGPSEIPLNSDVESAFTPRRLLGEMATRNWTARSAAEANGWRSVTWSPDLGLFCAVSFDGTNKVMTSL
jgi:hypothetical protein